MKNFTGIFFFFKQTIILELLRILFGRFEYFVYLCTQKINMLCLREFCWCTSFDPGRRTTNNGLSVFSEQFHLE